MRWILFPTTSLLLIIWASCTITPEAGIPSFRWEARTGTDTILVGTEQTIRLDGPEFPVVVPYDKGRLWKRGEATGIGLDSFQITLLDGNGDLSFIDTIAVGAGISTPSILGATTLPDSVRTAAWKASPSHYRSEATATHPTGRPYPYALFRYRRNVEARKLVIHTAWYIMYFDGYTM